MCPPDYKLTQAPKKGLERSVRDSPTLHQLLCCLLTLTSAPAPCSSPITEAEQSKRRRSQLADRISNKLHALFWALVGVTVVYRTDFIRVLMEDERVDR